MARYRRRRFRHRTAPQPLVAQAVIADRAGQGRPLAMRVETDPHGICVTALDSRGQPLACVVLDYYADRLTALTQEGRDDLPPHMHVLVPTVSARRRGAHRTGAGCPAAAAPLP